MDQKYGIAGHKVFEGVDYNLLRKQKQALVFLEVHYRDTIKDREIADNLMGLINFIDNFQDDAVNIISKTEKEVFDIN